MGPGKEASMGESSVWGRMTYISFLSKFPSLGKEACLGKMPRWPATFMCGGMAYVSVLWTII